MAHRQSSLIEGRIPIKLYQPEEDPTEAVVRRYSIKKLFLEISPNSQENTTTNIVTNITLFLNRCLYTFSNGHIRNVVLTLPNIVKIDVENDNVVSTLSNVVQFNVEKRNVVSTLF